MMSASKISLCTFLVLITSCAIKKNRNLEEDNSLYEKDQAINFQAFNDFPNEEGLNLAIRNYDHLWNKKSLSVCWENDNNKNNGKAITQEIVTSEFAKVGFDFTGWNKCDSNGADIRINVGDYLWPRVSSLGKNLQNVQNGVTLTFSFDQANSGSWAYRCKINPNYRDNCIRNYALHEFGHVIALEHEANRADSFCADSTNAAVIAIGEYDQDSIMNYCANRRFIQSNLVPKLSSGDISGINDLYSSVPDATDTDTGSDNDSSDNDSSDNDSSTELSGQNFILIVSGNHLVSSTNILACPDNGDNSGIKSIDSFNFTNGSVTVRLSLDTGFNNHSQYFGVEGPGGSLFLRLFQRDNTYQLKAGQDSIDLVHKTYSPVNDNYLKISHQAAYNRVTFWTSRDGSNWIPFGYRTFTDTNNMKLIYKCGTTPSNIQDVKINNVAKGF
ncbi:MAG: hypothetical protein AB8G05_04795 [Oligoflexales bacterium]